MAKPRKRMTDAEIDLYWDNERHGFVRTIDEMGAKIAKRKSDAKIEHPGDWHSQEGPFAKACSGLGYRLLSLADKTAGQRWISQVDELILRNLDRDLKVIGG